MTVYVVEQGSYSDRQIVGVFSSEEKAAQFCALHNEADYGYGDSYYSAYDLDEWEEEGKVTPMWVYRAYRSAMGWNVAFERVLSLNEVQKMPMVRDEFWIALKSPDEEKAKKIMHDKLAERKAREAGV